MGALMRGIDWSTTPVGTPERWPQSLRTAVSIVLESRFAMYIAWGSDYTQFYNDGYRPILGSTKHPAALGLSASKTFAESWQIIGPMFDGVLAGEAVDAEDWMLPLARHGYLEECYFTFSYSPIRAEGSEVGGVLVTVSETTTRVLHERRLRTLSEIVPVTVGDEATAWCSSAAGLAGNALDVPFALLYALDQSSQTVRLVASTSVEPGSVIAPEQLEITTEVWPLAAAMASGPQEVTSISTRLAAQVGPNWPEPIDSALVLPIARPGVPTYGFLVAGLSPRLELDDKYRDFLRLVADQAATGVSNARTHQEERLRLEALAQLDHARRALEVAVNDARSAARAKDEFLALLGHELRNPLAPILTAVELMRVREFSNVRRECAVIERQTQHLVRLVDDLLDVARIARGKIELDMKRVQLASVIAKSTEMASPLFEQRRHRLDIDVPLGLVVNVDAGRMAQVFANLLMNAAKYTQPDGHVTVTARAKDAEIIAWITDNGIGMSPEMLPTIFDMFVQERQALDRAQGGLGLGLTIVSSLVAQHGGTIAARSAGRGHGSEFEVRLPNAGAVPALEPHDPPVLAMPSTLSRRVLIVDDNDDAARLLSDVVTALGHETEVAHDGPSALKLVERFHPDLALLDIGLPVMDGYELGRRLRSSKGLEAMRIVAVTGYGQADDRRRSHESGFDAHLVKPVKLDGLVTLLESLLPAQPALL